MPSKRAKTKKTTTKTTTKRRRWKEQRCRFPETIWSGTPGNKQHLDVLHHGNPNDPSNRLDPIEHLYRSISDLPKKTTQWGNKNDECLYCVKKITSNARSLTSDIFDFYKRRQLFEGFAICGFLCRFDTLFHVLNHLCH